MSNIPPIVVGVDGSAISYGALSWAAQEAERHRVPLLIIAAIALPITYGAGITFSQHDFDRADLDGKRLLSEATRIARAALAPGRDLVIFTELAGEPPIPALLDASKGSRLVVVGSRGAGAFSSTLLGSVSAAVTCHARCPVAVIHEGATELAARTNGPVVVGVDGSGNCLAAIAVAFEEASLRGTELVAVHAWSDTNQFIAPGPDWPAVQAAQEAVVAESLARGEEQFPEVSVRSVVVNDRPAPNLIAHAETAQLVVVGSHGRGGFAGMLLGSTSQVVLHGTACPIIIVREEV